MTKYSGADRAIMSMSEKDIDRFYRNLIKRKPNECWGWALGHQKGSGHALFSIKRSSCFAHRVFFYLKNGYLPDTSKNRIVMHDCENPSCLNPKHLLEGTPIQNGNYPGCIAKLKARIGPLSPMWGRRGKLSPRFGMKHSKATRTVLRERAIARGGWHKGMKRSEETRKKLSLLFRGENSPHAKLKEYQVLEIFKAPGTYASLAREYKVDPSIISLIKAKKIWKHILT